MGLSENAIRRLTVIANDQGLTALNTKLQENERISNAVSSAQTRMANATAAADARIQALLRQRDRYTTQYNRWGTGGVAGTGYDAVRVGAPVAGNAAMGLASAAMPAMLRLAPYATAAATVYAQILAINAVIEHGTELLEKYANAHRNVDRSDLTSNLESLGKYQTDKISAAQVKYATELGTRLENANWQIEKFLKTSLDITDPALKLQSVWVGIVEAIAKATGYADVLLDKMSKLPAPPGPGMLALVPGGAAAYSAYRALSTPTPAAPTADQSMAAARGKLGSALETAAISREGALKDVNSFSGRFGAAIYDINEMTEALKKNTKETKENTEARNAWDRALESVRRNIALQEADAAAVGKSVGEHAKLRAEAQLLEAGLRSGMTEAAVKASDAYKTLGERANAAAISLAELRLKNDLGFERDQLGRSDTEQNVAGKLRSIYRDDYASHMDGAIAQQIRFNENLKITKDLLSGSISGFGRDLRSELESGVKGWQAVENAGMKALQRLGDKLLELAENQAIQMLLGGGSRGGGGILGLLGGGGSNDLGGGLLWQDAANQFAAAFPVPIAHSGWHVGMESPPAMRFVSSSVFAGARRMHMGGLAGDEVPTILQKGERVIARGGSAGTYVDLSDNRTFHIGAGASMETVAQLRSEFARDRADRKAMIQQTVRDLKNQRRL